MHCWVHQDDLFNDEQVATDMREAWEHEGSKDELNIVLQGVERERKRAGWGATTFREKLGRGMDRQTKALWEQGASAFNDLGVIL
jgi:hypothetical protein